METREKKFETVTKLLDYMDTYNWNFENDRSGIQSEIRKSKIDRLLDNEIDPKFEYTARFCDDGSKIILIQFKIDSGEENGRYALVKN